MVWDPGWDQIFTDNAWGRYPAEDLVRFVARNFYQYPDRSQVRLLEIGCGPGANLWFMAREGFSVHGLDGSQVALQRAGERLAAEGLTAVLRQGDAMQLPYAEQFFDGVVDNQCIYANTLADSRRILAEVHRVLKPGGAFFSRAFMTGTYGDGRGRRMEGEPNTYLEITEGGFHQGYGVIRLTSEEDLRQLYGIFDELEYEYLSRSVRQRQHEIKEWLITCRKRAAGPGEERA